MALIKASNDCWFPFKAHIISEKAGFRDPLNQVKV